MELSPVFPIREEYYNQSIEEIREDLEPTPVNEILKGVVAYVEVRSNAENRSQAISIELQQLGAVVSNRLNGAVTHVIFREGRKRTKDWAFRHAIPLVSVGWIQACKRKQRRISEVGFNLMNMESDSDEASPITGIPAKRRLRSMQPKTFDEELKLSAERKKRATRRNAKRNALHQRAIEAEKNLQSLASDTVRNYYANPCIRVPRTPPSMKEFTERLERKRDGSDAESPSTQSSVTSKMPRRCLFPSPSCQEPSSMSFSFCEAKDSENATKLPGKLTSRISDQQASKDNFQNRACEIQSYVSPLRSDTSFRSGRKLFNATAFEASGVIIEPQYSSNRLQNISKVFPKSFCKRNIIPSSKKQKNYRKRSLPVQHHDSESDSADTSDELKYPTPAKSRRMSCDSFVDSVIPDTNKRDLPSHSPLVRESPKVVLEKYSLEDDEEAIKEEMVISGDIDESPLSSTQSTGTAQSKSSKISKPRRNSYRKTVSDVLEVIDQEDKFRNFIKKPLFGCSSFVQRKSVRFSDQRENSPVFGDSRHSGTADEGRSTSSISEIHDETTELSTPSSLVKRRSMCRNENKVQNNINSCLVSKRDSKKLNASIDGRDTDAESINMGDLIDAIKDVSQSVDLDQISTSTHMSPKRRRSSRLKGRHSSFADSSSSTRDTSISIINQSSPQTNKRNVSRRSTPGSSSRSSTVGAQQRLRYSYESDACCPKSDEEVYGVLLMEKPSKARKPKRISVESIVKAVTASPSSSQSERNYSIEKTRLARPSIDDFKLSNVSQKSGSSQGNQSSSRLKHPTANTTTPNGSSDRILRKKLIVFTSLHKGEQESGRKAVMSLGNGKVNEVVTSTTTHVVTNWPIRRTLNLLRGVVFGCHIVTLCWLTDSREAGFWLPEEQYRINEVPTPKENPSIRNLFQSFKGIYVDNGVSPPQKELKALIQLAGGKVESSVAKTPQRASVIISSQSGDSTCVSPKWILDSIMEKETLPLHEYQST